MAVRREENAVLRMHSTGCDTSQASFAQINVSQIPCKLTATVNEVLVDTLCDMLHVSPLQALPYVRFPSRLSDDCSQPMVPASSCPPLRGI
jgi:hypothetical protein